MKCFVIFAAFALLFAVACAVPTQEEEAQLQACVAHNNDCAGCQATSGCGFCGGFDGQGYCVSGDAAGSQLAPFFDDTRYEIRDECPSFLWKFSDCDSPIRFTQKVVTVNSVTIVSISINPQTAEKDAQWDILVYAVGHNLESEDDGYAAFFVAYARGSGKTEPKTFELYGVGFAGLLEYAGNGAAFDCSAISSDKGILDCPGYVTVAKATDLVSWSAPTSSETDLGNGATMFTGSVTTTDGLFGLNCVTANDGFTYEGAVHSPYDIKCDVNIGNYQYEAATNQLAMVTVVVSAKALRTQGSAVGRVDFGDQAFFSWAGTANSTNGMVDIVGSNVYLDGHDFPRLPEAGIFVTVFSVTGANSGGATMIDWDPEVGVNPEAAVNPASAIVVSVLALFAIVMALLL